MTLVYDIEKSFNSAVPLKDPKPRIELIKEALEYLNIDTTKPSMRILTILDEDEFEIYREVTDNNDGFNRFGSVFGANTDINTETFTHQNYRYCISFEEEIR